MYGTPVRPSPTEEGLLLSAFWRCLLRCLLALPFGDAPNQIADFLAQSLISASSIPGLADHRRIRYRRFILQFGCLGTTKCVELRFDLVIVPLYIKAGYFSSCLGICLSKDSSVFNGPVSPNSPLSPSGPVSPNGPVSHNSPLSPNGPSSYSFGSSFMSFAESNGVIVFSIT